MDERHIEELEVDLLLDAVFRRYGCDFRPYARASVDRRVRQFLKCSGCASVSEIIPRILRDRTFAGALIQQFSISVTEMFRDPLVYLAIRREIVPLLKTYPHVKIWHAGCATGEEVYSMAILLKEEGIGERASLFGTDFNDSVLEKAREGVYPADKMKEFTRNYQQAGGATSFAEYYHAGYESAVINSGLKKRITFANHNLVTDGVFGEMHLVFCRNVLIYFNKPLQSRALRLFTDSLVRGGFLCLGTKEDLQFTEVRDDYDVIDARARIYRKKIL